MFTIKILRVILFKSSTNYKSFLAQLYIKTTHTTVLKTTTMFITYNTSYSEKFFHTNLARLIDLGRAKMK